MVIKRELILERLKELDTIRTELSQYHNRTEDDLKASLSLRWTIERGLIAAANIIFDIADHVLSGYFGVYPETYEESLLLLYNKGVLSSRLYQQLKGLGGFRNILVHEYIKIDIAELHRNFIRGLKTFVIFSKEIQQWLQRIK